METKICKNCGKELPIEEFGLNPNSKNGHICTCKRCQSGLPKEEFLVCPVCGQKLPYYNFSTGGKYGRIWLCKECEQANPEWRKKSFRMKYDQEFKDKINAYKRDNRKANFESEMWRAAKRRAKENNLEFNIEISDIIIPEICPILEVPLIKGDINNYEYTPSLDRIDNSKGYIKGNIMVISKKANSMKNSASWEELKKFCKNILRYSPNNSENETIEYENKESHS